MTESKRWLTRKSKKFWELLELKFKTIKLIGIVPDIVWGKWSSRPEAACTGNNQKVIIVIEGRLTYPDGRPNVDAIKLFASQTHPVNTWFKCYYRIQIISFFNSKKHSKTSGYFTIKHLSFLKSPTTAVLHRKYFHLFLFYLNYYHIFYMTAASIQHITHQIQIIQIKIDILCCILYFLPMLTQAGH